MTKEQRHFHSLIGQIVTADKPLDRRERCVVIALCRLVDSRGHTTARIQDIAAEAALDRNQTAAAIKRLEKRNVIERTWDDGRWTKGWALHLPKAWDAKSRQIHHGWPAVPDERKGREVKRREAAKGEQWNTEQVQAILDRLFDLQLAAELVADAQKIAYRDLTLDEKANWIYVPLLKLQAFCDGRSDVLRKAIDSVRTLRKDESQSKWEQAMNPNFTERSGSGWYKYAESTAKTAVAQRDDSKRVPRIEKREAAVAKTTPLTQLADDDALIVLDELADKAAAANRAGDRAAAKEALEGMKQCAPALARTLEKQSEDHADAVKRAKAMILLAFKLGENDVQYLADDQVSYTNTDYLPNWNWPADVPSLMPRKKKESYV
jgi:hypothetical protein